MDLEREISLVLPLYTENLYIIYATLWTITFYLYGMQRASLLICRRVGVEWKNVGAHLLPHWYVLTILPRTGKWITLLAIFYFEGWLAGLMCFVLDALFTTFAPIPYRKWYAGAFYKQSERLFKQNLTLGLATRRMLEEAEFTRQ